MYSAILSWFGIRPSRRRIARSTTRRRGRLGTGCEGVEPRLMLSGLPTTINLPVMPVSEVLAGTEARAFLTSLAQGDHATAAEIKAFTLHDAHSASPQLELRLSVTSTDAFAREVTLKLDSTGGLFARPRDATSGASEPSRGLELGIWGASQQPFAADATGINFNDGGWVVLPLADSASEIAAPRGATSIETQFVNTEYDLRAFSSTAYGSGGTRAAGFIALPTSFSNETTETFDTPGQQDSAPVFSGTWPPQGSATGSVSGEGQLRLPAHLASEGGWIVMQFSAFEQQHEGAATITAQQATPAAISATDAEVGLVEKQPELEASRSQSQAFELSDANQPRLIDDSLDEVDAAKRQAIDLALAEGEFAASTPELPLPTDEGFAPSKDTTANSEWVAQSQTAVALAATQGSTPQGPAHAVLLAAAQVAIERVAAPPSDDAGHGQSGWFFDTVAEPLGLADLAAQAESVLAYRTDELSLAQELGLAVMVYHLHVLRKSPSKQPAKPLPVEQGPTPVRRQLRRRSLPETNLATP